MTTEFFLINLDGSDDRLARATENFEQAGLSFKRVSAFDGRRLTPTSYPAYNDARCRSYMGRSMTGGEIGCYVSHQRAAQQFLDTDAQFGVVLEDDFEWSETGAEVLQALLTFLKERDTDDWHLINIGPNKLKFSTPIATLNGHTVSRAHYFPMLSTGLIWNRNGAQEFLKQSEVIFAPLDNLMRFWLTRSDKGLTIWPAIARAGGFESDIDQEGARTNTSNRVWHYGFTKQKRLWMDKFLAARHRAQARKKG